ncbi:hypothetical protein C1645_819173 [Glomus cerebriforme]|uniref:Crinkler effector protein N-terminal domain-containing protein n=1 Tax=Glomus cerebriforme TaxID=658196 RepID=A0A397T5P7_9GLOM|nr:hypothetical protein C1645_819173 [Glomus cerebriforme]
MSINGTPITLWCLEYGSSSFSITIRNNNSIFDLKKTIFEKISVPVESNTPDGLMTDENEIKIAMQKVGNTFHGIQDNNIRVVVRVPVATEQSVIPETYYYTKIPSKVIDFEIKLNVFIQALKKTEFDAEMANNIFKLSDDAHFLRISTESLELYICKCYNDLLDVVFDDKIRKLHISGNPGIGKTFFGYYLLYTFLKDDCAKIIIYDDNIKKDEVIIFNKNIGKLLPVITCDILNFLFDENTWYIMNRKKPIGTKIVAKPILICSPKKDHFYEFDKVSVKKVRELYEKWEGIPQYILKCAFNDNIHKKLEQAITKCDEKVLQYIGESGNSKDDKEEMEVEEEVEEVKEVDYKGKGRAIAEVEKVEKVDEESYMQIIIKFASDYVGERITAKLKDLLISRINSEVEVVLDREESKKPDSNNGPSVEQIIPQDDVLNLPARMLSTFEIERKISNLTTVRKTPVARGSRGLSSFAARSSSSVKELSKLSTETETETLTIPNIPAKRRGRPKGARGKRNKK